MWTPGVILTAISPLVALIGGYRSSQETEHRLRHVTIEARDYAFVAPATLSPGLTAFRFVNHGTVPHEVQLFRFAPGVSAKSARAYLAAGDAPDSAADPSGSVLIAYAGVTAREEILVSLKGGERYALICGFRDAPGKPKHATLGMVALLEID
jgi:hypothetical protein